MSPTLFEQPCGFFNLPQEPDEWKSCETGPYSFLSLSKKTRKSNCWQMSLQRQHFNVSFVKTLSVGSARLLVWPGFVPATSRSADQHSPNWTHVQLLTGYVYQDSSSLLQIQTLASRQSFWKQNWAEKPEETEKKIRRYYIKIMSDFLFQEPISHETEVSNKK